MPVNMGLTFLIGGLLGWLVVKILKPPPYLEGLIVATCSSGNATIYLDTMNASSSSSYVRYFFVRFSWRKKLNFGL